MRTKKGVVTSDKNDKTIVVTVNTYKMHPKYKKRYRTSKKFHAHDPENKHKVGDEVVIYETRPLSKLKRWTTIPHDKNEV
ncbi:30S ribosomal protein S17 [Candidatus Peregrinibacteria bacterium]|nr:30S ribosomal protein S17 [Candidatus Peregrinibacteria bacterium]